jgi:DNA modification methylase
VSVPTYSEFLSRKEIRSEACGIDVPASAANPILFPFQRDIVTWSLRRGRGAVFADTGLGKTFIQLEWARLLGVKTLIVAPLSVGRQTAREARTLGTDVIEARSGADCSGPISVTNYEMLSHFNPDDFGAVVLDECFAPDTPVDVFSIDGSPRRVYIKDVRVGDYIANASGVDTVSDIHRREVPYAIRLSISGRSVVCSPNHPWFTRRGWVGAQDIIPADEVVATSESVRMVREDIYEHGARGEEQAFLRAVLFSEMADESTGDSSEGPFSRGGREARSAEGGMAPQRIAGSDGPDREDSQSQPDERSDCSSENLPHVESDAPRTFRTWRKWPGHDGTTTDSACRARSELDGRVCLLTGPTDSWISIALQDRHRRAQAKNSYRGGWFLAPQPEGAGREEGCEASFARVDSLEILEPGHPDVERWRDADGRIYFYDLGGTRHPSFSVNGWLVHNSSILKALDGKTRRMLTEMFQKTPYRLCCTATPAPNDHVELGNHAEFLGICTSAEMRAMFFINANKEHTLVVDGKAYRRKGSNKGGQEWRLKHSAERPFFRWLASWAMMLTLPSDLGYADDGYILPPLNVIPHYVETEDKPDGEALFFTNLKGVGDRSRVRRSTLEDRLSVVRDLVIGSSEQWIVWVGLDAESKAVSAAIPGAVEVTGSDSPEKKAAAFEAFQDGRIRTLVTKGKIGGFGLNFQNARRMAFFGLNDSWELWYQCCRRMWRFGQREPVDVHVVLSDKESGIYQNILRKDAMATRLRAGLIQHVREDERRELRREQSRMTQTSTKTERGQSWTAMQGDSCERLKALPDASIDLSVFSPPFADLFTYTDSPRDLGNSRGWGEFFDHYGFIIRETQRVTKPGRLSCVHVSDIAAMQSRDGFIGVRDFPGEVIRAYDREGWQFVGRAFIQKNPQAQAIRVKSKALLFVQLRKDSADSRPALIDQILIFKAPGENAVPIRPVENGEMDNETWIEWAHGIWLGIHETDTLQIAKGRGVDDEKHICPLQLGTIERCIKLYSNPGETVLSPFMGIGSEGVQAVKFGRKFIGCELKESYFALAVSNLRHAEMVAQSSGLFAVGA